MDGGNQSDATSLPDNSLISRTIETERSFRYQVYGGQSGDLRLADTDVRNLTKVSKTVNARRGTRIASSFFSVLMRMTMVEEGVIGCDTESIFQWKR